MSFPVAPPSHHERATFERYRQDRDVAVRDALVVRFLPLVRRLALRYRFTSEPFDDLLQAGSIGLLHAIERYDPARDVAFTSFAVPTISGEIKRHFRDRTWSVKVPRAVRESIPRIQATESELSRTLGRSPTATEVAGALGVSLEAVLDARAAALVRWPESMDLTADEERVPWAARIAVEDRGFTAAEDGATLAHLLRCLDDRDREILRLYFTEDLTQATIAARMGYSQMHVSHLIRRALAHVRVVATADEAA